MTETGLEDTLAPDAALEATVAASEAPKSRILGTGGPSGEDGGGSLARGEGVGRYVVLDLLGKGGMGEVYKAYDPELDRRVALKVIHAAMRSGDPVTARSRLVREAQTLAKLSHPNVVAVYDVGEIASGRAKGDVYVAMEFVEGTDLRRWLEAEERVLCEILSVFAAAANGLAAAHDVGLVHRDVKPDNILIGADGRVRVIDFGIAIQDSAEAPEADAIVAAIAKAKGRALAEKSEGGSLVGTPAYMTPEQFLGHSAGGQSDQFSLCVALFEAVSGERPFPGKTLPELSLNVLENKRRELKVGDDMPAWLAAALERGLAPDPENRFESMRELAAALSPPVASRRGARWLLAVAAVIGIGGASAAYLAGGARSEADACRDVGGAAHEMWSDGRKREVDAAFRAADAERGPIVFERVSVIIDAFARDWSRAKVAACHEAAAGLLTQETSEKKLACLDRSLRELASVTVVFGAADEALLEEAVNTATSITRVSGCENLTRLAGEPELPIEMEDGLATLKTLERAGRYKEGLEKAGKLVERAAVLGEEAARARLLVWRGRLEAQEGKTAESVETYFEAIRVAEVAGDSYARAHAWTYVVWSVGVVQRERLAGLRWAEHAAIAIKQDGSPLELETKLVYHVAQIQRGLSRYERALSEFRRAEELSNEAYGSGSYEALLAEMGAAMTLRALSRLDESVETYERVIAGLAAMLGEDSPKLAPAHTNIGVVLIELKRYDEARSHYLRSLELKRTQLGPEHASVLITEMNLAILEDHLGNFAAALAGIRAVDEVRRKRFGDDYPELPDTLLYMASVAEKTAELREAEELARRALSIYRRRGKDAIESAALAEAMLCGVLRRQRRLPEARRSCEAAVASLRENAQDPRTLATALTISAHLELDSRRPTIARELANEAAAIRAKHSGEAFDHAYTAFAVAATHAPDPAALALARALLERLHPGDRALLAADIEQLQ